MRDAHRASVWRFETTADDIRINGGKSIHDELQAGFVYNYAAEDQDFHNDGGTINGQDYWISYAFLVEPGPVHHNQWLIIGQWHATEDGPRTAPGRAPDDALSPPFALNLTDGDRLVITSRTDRAAHQTREHYPAERFEWRDDKPIVRNTWHRVVIHVRFGWQGDGRLQVWIDEKRRVNRKKDYSIGYNDLVGPHWNFGAYRGWYWDGRANDPNPLAVEIANMEISATSLEDRVAHPRPISGTSTCAE